MFRIYCVLSPNMENMSSWQIWGKKFVTLSSFPHYEEKTKKNDKVLYYKAVYSFIAMKTISELYKNMNWLIPKSLELFFNKSIQLLKQGLNLFQRTWDLSADNLACSTSSVTLFSYLSFPSLSLIRF